MCMWWIVGMIGLCGSVRQGEFLAAWGWGVKDGAKEYEICESACQAGMAGAGKGQLDCRRKGSRWITRRAVPIRPGRRVCGERMRAVNMRIWRSSARVGNRCRRSDRKAWKRNGKARSMVWRWMGAAGCGCTGAMKKKALVERFSDALKNVFEEPVLEASVRCPKPGFAVSASGEEVFVDHERETAQGFCVEEGERARPVAGGGAAAWKGKRSRP